MDGHNATPSTLVPPRRARRGACREDANSPDTTKVASGKNRPHLCDGSANRDTIPQAKTGRSPRLLKAIECGVRFRSTAPYPAASECAAFIDRKASRQDMGLAFGGLGSPRRRWIFASHGQRSTACMTHGPFWGARDGETNVRSSSLFGGAGGLQSSAGEAAR